LLFLLGCLIFYSAHSLLFAAFDTEQNKSNPTKRAPRTRRTPRPKTSKANTKTNPTPSNKAKAKAKTVMTNMKKGGRHPDTYSFWDHFGDRCKYRGHEGTMKVPRTNDDKNQPLADWVHYVRKRKAIGILTDHHVAALNGMDFQWTAGQSPRGQFEVRSAELEELKKTNDTVSFIGEEKKEFPNLASWK
jgi:hypothetical protein